MLRYIATAALALMLAVPAAANEKIEGVISAQIEAFLQDDFEQAFTYASPMIQRSFQTPEKFGRMVRQGYPMVWRPEEVTFLSLEQRGQRLWQNVLIRDRDDKLHIVEYQMIEVDGRWLINGVRIRRASAGSA